MTMYDDFKARVDASPLFKHLTVHYTDDIGDLSLQPVSGSSQFGDLPATGYNKMRTAAIYDVLEVAVRHLEGAALQCILDEIPDQLRIEAQSDNLREQLYDAKRALLSDPHSDHDSDYIWLLHPATLRELVKTDCVDKVTGESGYAIHGIPCQAIQLLWIRGLQSHEILDSSLMLLDRQCIGVLLPPKRTVIAEHVKHELDIVFFSASYLIEMAIMRENSSNVAAFVSIDKGA